MLPGLLFFPQLVPSSAYFAKAPLPLRRWLPLRAENGVSMDGLSLHQEDALWIGETVQSWLDQEFIALPVHRKIGEMVRSVYLKQRGDGVNDLGEMLMKMGSSLETFDLEDAFVGPWDIANKVRCLMASLTLSFELDDCILGIGPLAAENESRAVFLLR